MNLDSSAALKQLRQKLNHEQSGLIESQIKLLISKVANTKRAWETACNDLRTVKSLNDNDIRAFNTARMEFFLQAMAEDGMIWDSFKKEFFPDSGEIYYAVMLSTGARISEDDFVETLRLHQTPNRKTRNSRCYAQPWIGCVVPVVMVGDPPTETAPDDRCSKKLWKELCMHREVEARKKLSNLHRIYPSEISAELAEKYGIPPILDLININKLDQKVA